MSITTSASWTAQFFTTATRPLSETRPFSQAAGPVGAAVNSIGNTGITKTIASHSGETATGAATPSYDFSNMTPSQFMDAFTDAFHAGKISEATYFAGIPIGMVPINSGNPTSPEPSFDIFDRFQDAVANATAHGDTKTATYYASILDVLNRLQGTDRSADIRRVDITA